MRSRLRLLGALAVVAARAHAAEPPPLSELTQLQDAAIAANPDLDARRAAIQEIAERAAVAGAWVDPVVSVEYSNAPVSTWSIADHPMAGVQLRVQQALRPPQWSARRRAPGEHEAQARGHTLSDAELSLRAAVARAYWSLHRTRLLREVTVAHIARTEELLEIVVARYKVGAVGQHAVLRLEVLRDRLTDNLADFDRTEREHAAALARALGQGAAPPVLARDTIAVSAPPEAVDWRALAERDRPALDALDERIAAEQAGVALAETEALPDPVVWAGYRVRVAATETDPGTDFVSVGVGVPLPLGSGRMAGGERQARLSAVARLAAERRAMLDAIAAEGETALARWQRSADRAKTYTDVLIPAATSALQTTQADFATGRADFASLFEAEVALLDLERAVIEATIDTHVQHAETTALVGANIGGSP
ncbi:MAG TPA: TolC family protein [Deltaproteobacteria bacterium]|nr:TolC family protein [Deltaproteobacteria bacterium]